MACRLRQLFRKNAFGHHIVSLNGITASAISALQTNQAALSVVSNNVANLNTPGYARRVVNEQTLAAGGQLMGVDIASVAARHQPVPAAGAAVGGRHLLAVRHHGQAVHPAERPSGRAGRQPVARHRPHQSGLGLCHRVPGAHLQRQPDRRDQCAATAWHPTFSNVSSTISSLQGQIDQQVVNSVGSTNSLIQQIYHLNSQIKTANATGDDASGAARPARHGADQPGPGDGHQDHAPMPMAASMSPPPTASIWSVNTYASSVLCRRRAERHLWQYHHPGHQSGQRPT